MKKILFGLVIAFAIVIFPDVIFASEVKYARHNELSISAINATTYVLDDANNFWGDLPAVKCGGIEVPAPIPSITRIIVNFIKIATPLVLIVMGMIDMMMAVIASDEKKIKESQQKFPRRLLPAALVFLVVTIVQFLVGVLADNTSEKTSLINCVDCMISDAEKCQN